jgi:hypothetical protein
MGRRKGTWEDTGVYEVEEMFSHFLDRVGRMEERWRGAPVRERVSAFGLFLHYACKPKGGVDTTPETEERV